MKTPEKAIDKASSAGKDKVSDIQSLTLRVRDLSQSVDLWNDAIIWTLVFAALAAIAVGLVTGIAFSKAKRLNEAQTELGQIKDKQLDEVAKRQRPSTLPPEVLKKALSDKPPAKAEILYSPEGGEPYQFSLELFFGLWALKWEVAQPKPIPPDLAIGRYRTMPKELLAALPATMRVGGQPTGVTLVVKNGVISYTDLVEGKSVRGALSKALADTLGSIAGGQDESLPEDMIRIVVGAKP